MEVYEKVPIEECWRETGKAPIAVRWVDINKGDDDNPEIRCRWVGREFKGKDNKRDDLFAATPPLECKKLLFSMAVTNGIGYNGDRSKGMKLDFIDIRRAYFHARARGNLCGIISGRLKGRILRTAQQIHVWHSRCSTKLGA